MTRADQAYGVLKYRITRLELAPGSIVTEGELAAYLNTSKTPVREALVRLERERFVDVMPHSGYRIRPMTLRDAQDLFAVSAVLESEAAGLAARCNLDNDTLERLAQFCVSEWTPVDPSTVDRYLETHNSLHMALADVVGNEHLTLCIRGLLDQTERYFHLALALSPGSLRMNDDHRQLVAAIAAHDESLARALAKDQCDLSMRAMLEALMSSETVTNANIGRPETWRKHTAPPLERDGAVARSNEVLD